MAKTKKHQINPAMHYTVVIALIISLVTTFLLGVLLTETLFGGGLGYFSDVRHEAQVNKKKVDIMRSIQGQINSQISVDGASAKSLYDIQQLPGGGGSGSDTQSPSVPTDLKIIDTNCTGFTFNWSPSTDNVGVRGYAVWEGTYHVTNLYNGPIFNSNGGFYAFSTHTYRVTAFDEAGNHSQPSEEITLDRPQDCVPVAPRNPVVKGVSERAIGLSWDDYSNNEDTFHIVRVNPDNSNAEVGIVRRNVTTFIDNTVEAGERYCYFVRAKNELGYSGYSQQGCGSTSFVNVVPTGAYLAPEQVSAGDITSVSVYGKYYGTDENNGEGLQLEDGFAELSDFEVLASRVFYSQLPLTDGDTIIYRYTGYFNTSGLKQMKFVLDGNNVLEETNEDDNTIKFSFRINR